MRSLRDDGLLRFEAPGLNCPCTKQILEFAAIGIYLVPRWNSRHRTMSSIWEFKILKYNGKGLVDATGIEPVTPSV
jgi:hypothetical protein